MIQSSEIFSKLWNLLNKRRGNGNIDILRHIVPEILFLFAVSVQYEKEKNNKPRFETFDDPAYFTLIPPPESQWKKILKCLKKDPQNIKENVYKALEAIEKVKAGNNSLEGLTYKEHFKNSDLTDYDLQQIINDFDEEFQEFSKQNWEGYDFLGNAYQFFLQQFAAEGGKQGGQFYTPSDVVELLVRLLQIDKKGAIVYDPCCGSGGMFVKANRLNMDKELVFLGQELIPDTTRLAKRRLIMEGIKSFQIIQGDTLFKDEHSNEKADFILANPPFNQEDNKMVEGDERWKDIYGSCKKNTNYGWISHIIYKLKPEKGVGAVIMTNATLSSSNRSDVEMRKKWINDNLVEAIITLPNKLFYTTPIFPCIWILRKGRKTDEVLMIDISQEDFGEKIGKTKKSDKERILTSRDIEKVTQVYQKFLKERKITNSPARIVPQKEIEENYYILVPTFYLKPEEVKLTQKEINKNLLSTTEELEKLIEEQEIYHKQLRELLKDIKKETDEEMK